MDKLWNMSLRVSYILVALSLLLWGLVPSWKTIAAGTILGVSASIMNALLLRRRAAFIAMSAAGQDVKRRSMGLASRLATVLLAVMIANKYPDRFNLVATLSACFIMPFIILAAAYFQQKQDKG